MPQVTIRELDEGDAAALTIMAADSGLADELPFDAEADEWVALAGADVRARERARWVLAIDHGGERAVGVVVLSIDSRVDGRAEIGFAVRRDRRGLGIASAAVSLLVETAFGRVGLHRLWAVCSPDNVASRRVLERNGFELEGRLRHDRRRGTEWFDSLLYGLVVASDAV